MKNKQLIKISIIILVACAVFGFVVPGTSGVKVEKNNFCKLVEGYDGTKIRESPVYFIARSNTSFIVDANWEKPQWKQVKPVEILNHMGERPLFSPYTEAKMMYDEEHLYIIFRVHDKYVRSVIRQFNGPVYEDSAVEFFFSPDNKCPGEYFDLEINCGGTPLICYVPNKKEFTGDDIKKISIAHSMPNVVDPEIKKEVIWTIECKIPFQLLEKFTAMSRPNRGDCWRANFFKTASKGSNPHYMTWAVIKSSKPNFHLPEFFGKLKFL